jgi:hypothetical protein
VGAVGVFFLGLLLCTAFWPGNLRLRTQPFVAFGQDPTKNAEDAPANDIVDARTAAVEAMLDRPAEIDASFHEDIWEARASISCGQ